MKGYREWHKTTERVLEHMDPLEQRDAAYECGCGQRTLRSDRRRTCNCFGTQNAPAIRALIPTPDLMTTFKEATMDTTTEAPYGFKKDGSPRKRPTPSPEHMAKAAAGRAAAQAAKRNARSHVSAMPVTSPIVVRMIAELDDEIAVLTAARDALTAVAA